jgi:Holliday junction resolvase RusA-like endonuclease
MVFSLQAPARIPVDRFVGGIPYPSCYPDGSKLIRSTEDALTGILWGDDGQIVRHGLVEKRYAGWPGSLSRPGAVITVQAFGGAR